MNTREPYTLQEQTIKKSLVAFCVINRTDVRVELFEDAIDELKSSIPQIVRYTLFTYTEVCELCNYVSNMIRDPANSRMTLQSFLKDIYNDLENVKIGLKYAMDKLYDA